MFDLTIIPEGIIKDKDLIKETEKIFKCGSEISRNMLKIAYLLNQIDKKQLYSEDFDSMEEYTKKVFNLKKSSMYNLLKIGKNYVEVNASGQKYFCNIGSFQYGQLTKMISLEKEEVLNLIKENKIDPSMSCRTIEKIVKSYSKNYKDSDPEESEDNENIISTDAEYTEEQKEELERCRPQTIIEVTISDDGSITVCAEPEYNDISEKIYDIVVDYIRA